MDDCKPNCPPCALDDLVLNALVVAELLPWRLTSQAIMNSISGLAFFAESYHHVHSHDQAGKGNEVRFDSLPEQFAD